MKKNFENHIKNKRNNRVSLRVFFSGSAVRTMCISCLLACALVCGGSLLFYRGEYTVHFVVGICLLVCALAAFIGSHLLLYVAETFIKPIEKVNEAVKKVTEGDFTVAIEMEEGKNAIDEFVTLEQNFNKMTSELYGMDYMRKDFMSNVSHEIKTPIAAIMGFIEILQGEHLSEEERKEYLKLLEEESGRLSRLCENMLRMSRLDNQEIVANKEIKIESNPDFLSQVWMNLIDNAMKYSPDKSVIHISSKNDMGYIEIIIRDEGIGIPEEKKKYIFDKFYQCEESHKKMGNGLGLSIVKRIIELLDGEIQCESEYGFGTTIMVKLKIPLI